MAVLFAHIQSSTTLKCMRLLYTMHDQMHPRVYVTQPCTLVFTSLSPTAVEYRARTACLHLHPRLSAEARRGL